MQKKELIKIINGYINTPMGTSVSRFVDEYLASLDKEIAEQESKEDWLQERIETPESKQSDATAEEIALRFLFNELNCSEYTDKRDEFSDNYLHIAFIMESYHQKMLEEYKSSGATDKEVICNNKQCPHIGIKKDSDLIGYTVCGKSSGVREELIKAFDWLTKKDSPYAICYGNKHERFATTEDDYSIESVVDEYLKAVRDNKL